MRRVDQLSFQHVLRSSDYPYVHDALPRSIAQPMCDVHLAYSLLHSRFDMIASAAGILQYPHGATASGSVRWPVIDVEMLHDGPIPEQNHLYVGPPTKRAKRDNREDGRKK